MFRSLAIRNYRIWFIAAFISNIGGWMQTTAQSWVVLTELSHNDALAVGLTMSLQFGPQLLLVPIVGSVIDRFDRKIILFSTQSFLLILATSLGLLLLLGQAELWHIYVFATLLGITNAFDAPARQTFVSDMVDDKLMANAVALNSTTFNAARLIGPAIAGVLIAILGAGWVFILNGSAFLATLIGLMFIHRAALKKREKHEGGVRFSDGLKYVGTRPDLIIIFVAIFLIGTFAMNFPIFSSTMAVEFGEGAGEYGAVSSILAIGSFTAALFAARRERARLRVMILSSALLSFSLAFSAIMPTFWTYAASNALIGFATVSTLVTANGYVQTTAPAWVRGRVMTIYTAILLGGTSLGSPVIGWIANAYGPRWGIMVGAIASFSAAIVGIIWLLAVQKLRFRWSPDARRIVLTRYSPAEFPLEHRFNDTVTFTAPINLPALLDDDEDDADEEEMSREGRIQLDRHEHAQKSPTGRFRLPTAQIKLPTGQMKLPEEQHSKHKKKHDSAE